MAKLVTKHLTKVQIKDIKTILKSLGKSTALTKYKWNENNVAMGSGGVGQIQLKPRLGIIRVQTSYGKGRNNYANVIEINIGVNNYEKRREKK